MKFKQRLGEMRKDLISIVDRMNRDRSENIAEAAQDTLRSLRRLQEILGEWGNDLDWKWQPNEDKDEDVI